jgi:hypothetical protein
MHLIVLFCAVLWQGDICLPCNPAHRYDVSQVKLTDIGQFGLKRKARPGIPEHYHTGIDIKRPGKRYDFEPIFPIAEGVVISKRTDGPYANLIIEHIIKGAKIWTLYEHIAEISVHTGDVVHPSVPIARFMNKEELNRHGWQFDHFHFELIKVRPLQIPPTAKTPERFFNAYTLTCYNLHDLNRYYEDPLQFFKRNL